MVIGNEKSLLVRNTDKIIDSLSRIHSFVSEIVFFQLLAARALGILIIDRALADLLGIILPFGVEIQMADLHFLIDEGGLFGELLDGALHARDRNEVLIVKVCMAVEVIVVCDRKEAVAVRLIKCLELLGCLLAVGAGTVAMHIALIVPHRCIQ